VIPRIDDAEAAARALARAESILVITGAGMSAESGIPTFRGPDGLWEGRSVEDVATPEGFARDPAGVWQWYSDRRRNCLQTEPHAGHVALARLEHGHRAPVTIATQNIDGLHRRAGSGDVIELHGSLFTTRCSKCSHQVPEDRAFYSEPPTCEYCGAPMRPGVVWFGEMLPADRLLRAQALSQECDVVLVVGTSAVVQPVASLPLYARHSGATLVEVNPQETPLTPVCHFAFPHAAGEVLPQLVDRALAMVE